MYAVALVLLGLGMVVPGAQAYDEAAHSLMTRVALEELGLEGHVVTLEPDAAVQLLARVDRLAREGTAGVTWRARYPDPPDTWTWKQVFQLAPTARVFGIDRLDVRATSNLVLIAEASRQPDVDRRNRDRLAFDTRRRPFLDSLGSPVPADPAMLEFGRLGDSSSQLHAHRGGVGGTESGNAASGGGASGDAAGRPGTAATTGRYADYTLGAAMVQLHVELSLLAGLGSGAGANELAWLYLGHAIHYLEDLGNPWNIVPLPVDIFARDALFASLWNKLSTGGGYFGDVRAVSSLERDILTSHGRIADALVSERLRDAQEGRSSAVADRLLAQLRATDAGDEAAFDEAAFDEALAARDGTSSAAIFGFGERLAGALVARSAADAAPLAAATRDLSAPRYRTAGPPFDPGLTPVAEAVVAPTAENEAEYERFWELQGRSMRRTGLATRRLVRLVQAFLLANRDQPEAAEMILVERMVERQLRLDRAAERRRAGWSSASDPAEHFHVVLLAEVLGVTGMLLLLAQRLHTWRAGRLRAAKPDAPDSASPATKPGA